MDISVDYTVLDNSISAIKDIKSKCGDLISALSAVDTSILDSGYLLSKAVSTVTEVVNGPIETVLNRVTEVESLFYIFQNKDFFKEYLDANNQIDMKRLIEDMLSLVTTQESCFNMANKYDEILEKYSVELKGLQTEISYYEKYANGTFVLDTYDQIVTVRDMEYNQKMIEESKEKLPELQEKYDNLYRAMSLVNILRNSTRDKGYYLYGTYDDFAENSSKESRIANYEVNKMTGVFKFYDAEGNLLKDVNDAEAGIYFSTTGRDFKTKLAFSDYSDTYKYLTDDERKVANYLLNSGKKEALEEYFAFKKNYANQRHGEELANEIIAEIDSYYKNSDNAFSDSIAYTKTLGLLSKEGFGDGISNFFEGIGNLFSADGVISADQYKTSFIIQALNEKYDEKLLADTIATGAYEISTSIGNMLVPMTLGLISGCPTLGTAAMGLSAAGNSREQGLQSGMTDAQAWGYGILSGTSEAALEYFIGGIPGVSNLKMLEEVPGFKGFLAKMASEGLEESTQSIIEPFFKTIVTGEKPEIDWGEVLKSGIYGAITAGAMNGGQMIVGTTIYSIANMDTELCSYIVNKYEGQDLTDPTVQSKLQQDLSNYEVDTNIDQKTDTVDKITPKSDPKTITEIETKTDTDSLIEKTTPNTDSTEQIKEKAIQENSLLPIESEEQIESLNTDPLTKNNTDSTGNINSEVIDDSSTISKPQQEEVIHSDEKVERITQAAKDAFNINQEAIANVEDSTSTNITDSIAAINEAVKSAVKGVDDLTQKSKTDSIENVPPVKKVNRPANTSANNLSESKVQEMSNTILKRMNFVPPKVADKLANFFAEATTAAKTKYNGFFRAFREHTIYHTLAVAEYVQEKGQALKVNLKETTYAALFHDTGMKGGIAPNEDGSYSLIDEGLQKVQNDDGTYKFCKLDENGKLRDLTFKETYDLANKKTRKEHPRNSALTVLTNPDMIPTDVDRDTVALLAFSHSKSTSGIKKFSSKEQWLKCVKQLEESMNDYNSQYGTNHQFDSQKMRKMIENPTEFRRLQDEALLLRDADAMAEAIYVDGKLLMQDGSLSKVTKRNPRGKDYNREIKKGYIEEIGGKEHKVEGFELELPDEEIADTIYYEDGTIGHFDITNGSEAYSIKVHVGEGNVKFDSEYDGQKYHADVYLIDPNASPNCTWDAIEERLGEVITYDHVEDRQFVIKLPKEVLGEDGTGTVLSEWYEQQVINYKADAKLKDLYFKNSGAGSGTQGALRIEYY